MMNGVAKPIHGFWFSSKITTNTKTAKPLMWHSTPTKANADTAIRGTRNTVTINNLKVMDLISTDGYCLDDLFKCSACSDPMFPPIHQCCNGHTICSACKLMSKNKCPTCLTELGDIKCVALEKIAHTLQLPCKYHKSGCTEEYSYYTKLEHEEKCRFRPYSCPYLSSKCNVVGDIEFLVNHLKEHHKVNEQNRSTFGLEYMVSDTTEFQNDTWKLKVIRCFGQYFCIYFGAYFLGTIPVYQAFVQFMGNGSEARNYVYSLRVAGKIRKLMFEGAPQSIRVGHKDKDGLIIQRNMADHFLCGSDFKLRVSGKIWMKKEDIDQYAFSYDIEYE